MIESDKGSAMPPRSDCRESKQGIERIAETSYDRVGCTFFKILTK